LKIFLPFLLHTIAAATLFCNTIDDFYILHLTDFLRDIIAHRELVGNSDLHSLSFNWFATSFAIFADFSILTVLTTLILAETIVVSKYGCV
jgi:fructose 1,6-bisphosphatase